MKINNFLAGITLDSLEKWIPLITTLLSTLALIAFNWGVIYQKLKNFATKSEVVELIEEKLESHCPLVQPLKTTDERVNELNKWKEGHQHFSDIESGNIKLHLQEIRINLKNICERLDIPYHNGGNKS